MSKGPLPSSFDGNTEFYEENRWQKFSRRLKEEPLIPIGCILTCMALLGASRSIRAGDHNRTNRMFRARILAQGFTLVAMVAGSMYWQTDRQKRKEFEGAVAERKAREKNEAWIKELEARDEEAKELRALREMRMQGGGIKETAEKAAEKAKETVKITVGQEQNKQGKPPVGVASSMKGEEERTEKGIMGKVQNMILGGKK